MSNRKTFGVAFAEKIIGIILVVVGAALTYYTYVSTEAAGMSANFFSAAGVILIILGALLVIVETR